MNNILHLKGTLQQSPNPGSSGYPNLPKNSPPVTLQHLERLLKNLSAINDYWLNQSLISGMLVDVVYVDVIAKSNRIRGFFAGGGVPVNNSVVGARFTDNGKKRHVITHYVSNNIVSNTIKVLGDVIALVSDAFNGSVYSKDIEQIDKKKVNFNNYNLSKSKFLSMIVDAHYVEEFGVPDNRASAADNSIITVYRTDEDTLALFRRIGVDIRPDKIVNDTTFLLYPDEISLLISKAPYLIAMATEDISKMTMDEVVGSLPSSEPMTIAPPNEEPIIGVIDTMFDENVYFSEWVDFKKTISEDLPLSREDYVHGTAVSSIIVDGPSINPKFEDGCGRFKVRHFGVAGHGQYSAFSIMKSISEIVTSNKDIKVWNLSLGSDREINQNFISPEASILDRLQCDNDIVFVVAGTNNDDKDRLHSKMIGAPADSINSIVVNSVNSLDKPASYSRKGLVLSFFNKPDVCGYGGDKADKEGVRVCTPTGEDYLTGTSFAAPWITRKVAYLIHVLGLSREVAKALIVDAAAGWSDIGNDPEQAPLMGHGVVPRHIKDIVNSRDDEIKFVINGISEKYDTYTYNLPVPLHNDKYPFIAKATLCYFPKCSINQGVDYTNTELDIYLGRVDDKGIKSINKNTQSIDDGERHYMYEGEARKLYRKWDNTKHVREAYGDTVRSRVSYGSKMWGVSVKTKERLHARDGEKLSFGLVATLREINGVNRINDFVRQCELRGWFVSKLDIDNRIEIYNKAQETISFDV
jgi:Subtilisin-like serine proteases